MRIVVGGSGHAPQTTRVEVPVLVPVEGRAAGLRCARSSTSTSPSSSRARHLRSPSAREIARSYSRLRPCRAISSPRHASRNTQAMPCCACSCSRHSVVGRAFQCFQQLLTAQFLLIFQLLACRILAREIPQLVIKCAHCQLRLAAVNRPRHTAALPCFDMDPPERPPRLVLERSRSHRQSSPPRRNPTCCDIAPPKGRARSGRLRTGRRWQDKGPRGAAMGGCGFLNGYRQSWHIAPQGRSLQTRPLSSDLNCLERCAAFAQ